MRSKKPLITLLRKLVDAVEDEAARNPDFADKLDEVLRPFQEAAELRTKPASRRFDDELPDVHKELSKRSDREFRSWLREQAIETLKAIIRREDLDTARRASKWKDADRLADFIADGLRTRMSRGSAFIDRAHRQLPIGHEPRAGKGDADDARSDEVVTSTPTPTEGGPQSTFADLKSTDGSQPENNSEMPDEPKQT
ncbi:hypothetical protein VSR69_43430 [Paraburkholderia phytofirmans]